jgi:GTP-binding protein
VGEERWLRLELKLLADVALVGFPNVGKSTLIAAISAAKPKIADYPFTTLEPNLGVVRLDAATEYVVADIPGLIEGASEGKGLGHQFLRHIERARVLCVLVDLAWESTGGASPAEQQRVLLDELGRYQPDLLDRPRIVIGSRADIVGSDDTEVDFDGPRVSAVTGQGLRDLTGQLAELVREARAALPASEGFVVLRPLTEGFHVERVGEGWVITGREAERAVALSDLTSGDALAYAQQRLKSIGVDRGLARAGAQAGDLVRIGAFAFTYEPDDVYQREPTRRERRA